MHASTIIQKRKKVEARKLVNSFNTIIVDVTVREIWPRDSNESPRFRTPRVRKRHLWNYVCLSVCENDNSKPQRARPKSENPLLGVGALSLNLGRFTK
ncbi:hypothetical protein AVEN_125027-1 [Araneus ventricosus]|uniref:Uncharacterized protein n=1 Tax=Araneus ventricosus TaxID=182803 RepID=A0A4Y2H1D6_ARAVE|nr:hypothetical protein AVEN_125027-1 [Araneus ventricosus]